MHNSLKDGLVLYHGSYCEVVTPLLEKCAKFKDFGRGFYLTSSKEQAENFLKTSIGKAQISGLIDENQNFGFVSKFEVQLLKCLEIYEFDSADTEWLHCIAAHRRKRCFPEVLEKYKRYDVIAGKIADDQTNTTLAAYISGALGDLGDLETDNYCIKRLLPDKLKDQFCFKTENAIECLKFIGSEKIWLKKD